MVYLLISIFQNCRVMKSALFSLLFLASTVMSLGQYSIDDIHLLSSANHSLSADTVSARSPYVPVTGAGSITFATAFRWNRLGPTGGYWSENNVDDYTFRPVYSNIASYRLEIFNRNGYKVYESIELSKGWDGYLKNGALAAQGVYIWKASGKYSDGTPFNLKGDVTFIY